MEPVKVLFVCLGNICRSPMAEGLLQHMVAEARLTGQFQIASAGTSNYHEGDLPDRRMRETARKHGIELTSRARQLRKRDFHDYDYIAAMDRSVLRSIHDLRGQEASVRARVFLMRDYDPQPDSPDVPDPYYGGLDGFEQVYRILERSNVAFLQHLSTGTNSVPPGE